MDIQMSAMNGYETAETIRSLQDTSKATIPIIAMTANAFSEDRKKALESGMNDYVSKSIDMNKVKPAGSQCLCGFPFSGLAKYLQFFEN